jgi:hypothetical protein
VFSAEPLAATMTAGRQRPYAINRAKALSKMKYRLVCVILQLIDSIDALRHWIAQDVEAVCPDRQFSRKKVGRRAPVCAGSYKRTA